MKAPRRTAPVGPPLSERSHNAWQWKPLCEPCRDSRPGDTIRSIAHRRVALDLEPHGGGCFRRVNAPTASLFDGTQNDPISLARDAVSVSISVLPTGRNGPKRLRSFGRWTEPRVFESRLSCSENLTLIRLSTQKTFFVRTSNRSEPQAPS